MLQEVLWYIDGHHNTLEARSCTIPSELQSFTGYNVPEKSKHRKRAHVNLSQDVLLKHVTLLKESQLCSWMQLPKWEGLKDCVCKLTTVIEDYCTYLGHQCKSAKLNHNSLMSTSDSEVINVLPKIPLVSSRIKEIDRVVSEKPCYERICVSEICPVEPRKKYLFIQDLKKGLTVSAILCTCSMGSRLGNYHFCGEYQRV